MTIAVQRHLMTRSDLDPYNNYTDPDVMWRGSSSDQCCGSETTYLFKIPHFTNIPDLALFVKPWPRSGFLWWLWKLGYPQVLDDCDVRDTILFGIFIYIILRNRFQNDPHFDPGLCWIMIVQKFQILARIWIRTDSDPLSNVQLVKFPFPSFFVIIDRKGVFCRKSITNFRRSFPRSRENNKKLY